MHDTVGGSGRYESDTQPHHSQMLETTNKLCQSVVDDNFHGEIDIFCNESSNVPICKNE